VLLSRSSALGVVPDEIAVQLRPGDRLVLTTDGVHVVVEYLEALLTSPSPAQQVADEVASG
jgi:protein phosphatase